MNKSNIGSKIVESRKQNHVKAADLAEMIGVSSSTMSLLENGQLKGGPDPYTVIRIAEALKDNSILLYYIETNPVYQHLLPKIFPDLNNIRRDQSSVFHRFAGEAKEAELAARVLSDVFSNDGPFNSPDFDETFKAKMGQIVDINLAVEFLEFKLIASGVISKQWLQDVYDRQQRKRDERGHHTPELATGTEG